MPVPPKSVLSIQSSVVAGHVGNSAALAAYFAHGIEALALPTAILAHHPGRGPFCGRVTAASELATLIDGLRRLGALGSLDALASGWLGGADHVAEVAQLADDLKAQRPDFPYLCDPVLGDRPKGLYVAPATADALARDLVPRATIITPNHFEAEYLGGKTARSLADAVALGQSLRRLGPRLVVITSLERDDGAARLAEIEARSEALVVSPRGAWLCSTPHLAPVPNGSGDLLAALLLTRLLQRKTPEKALHFAMAAVYGVLRRSVAEAAPEMVLAGARGELTRPTFTPSIERVA